MKNLREALEKYDHDIVKALADLTNRSSTEIMNVINSLSADEYINLVAAVDKEDVDEVEAILDSAPAEEADTDKAPEVDQIKKRIKEITRNKKEDPTNRRDQVLDLVKQLKSKDWDLVWPDLDQNLLKRLYAKVDPKPVETISQEQADAIWKWTQDNIQEHVIYQDQIVEMRISRGPNNTVGIVINDRVRMVHRSEIRTLTEGVMGMTAMPTLARIRELAGMGAAGNSSERVAPISVPPSRPRFDEDDKGDREVSIPGGGTYSLSALRSKLNCESRELAAYLARDPVDYRSAAYYYQKLGNTLNTMLAALDNIESESPGDSK